MFESNVSSLRLPLPSYCHFSKLYFFFSHSRKPSAAVRVCCQYYARISRPLKSVLMLISAKICTKCHVSYVKRDRERNWKFSTTAAESSKAKCVAKERDFLLPSSSAAVVDAHQLKLELLFSFPLNSTLVKGEKRQWHKTQNAPRRRRLQQHSKVKKCSLKLKQTRGGGTHKSLSKSLTHSECSQTIAKCRPNSRRR